MIVLSNPAKLPGFSLSSSWSLLFFEFKLFLITVFISMFFIEYCQYSSKHIMCTFQLLLLSTFLYCESCRLWMFEQRREKRGGSRNLSNVFLLLRERERGRVLISQSSYLTSLILSF